MSTQMSRKVKCYHFNVLPKRYGNTILRVLEWNQKRSMVHRLNLPVGESEKENWQTTVPLLVQVLSFQSW